MGNIEEKCVTPDFVAEVGKAVKPLYEELDNLNKYIEKIKDGVGEKGYEHLKENHEQLSKDLRGLHNLLFKYLVWHKKKRERK